MHTDELINTDCLHNFFSIGLIYRKIHLKSYISINSEYNIHSTPMRVRIFYAFINDDKRNLFLLKLTTVFVVTIEIKKFMFFLFSFSRCVDDDVDVCTFVLLGDNS